MALNDWVLMCYRQQICMCIWPLMSQVLQNLISRLIPDSRADAGSVILVLVMFTLVFGNVRAHKPAAKAVLCMALYRKHILCIKVAWHV